MRRKVHAFRHYGNSRTKARAIEAGLVVLGDKIKRVVHCKRARYDVYIGRPSVWGNPFVIGKDGTRADVIAKYRAWLETQPDMIRKAKAELRGKVLACWCSPAACHGDVLAEVAND